MTEHNKLNVHKEPEHVKTIGLPATYSPFINGTSASRLSMTTTQSPQAICPDKPDVPKILNGTEQEVAKYTFGVKAPCRLEIIAMIKKYEPMYGVSTTIKENPKTLVIYKNLDAAHPEYDSFMLERRIETHDTFGVELKIAKNIPSLAVGQEIQKDTVITHSKNVHYDVADDPLYSTTLNFKTAMLSVLQTIEDGVVMSESAAKRSNTNKMKVVSGSFGERKVMLNLYGDDENYRGFPDVGQKVRPDGILMAFRHIDPIFGALNMTDSALQDVDRIYDEIVYAPGGSTVYDVSVIARGNEGTYVKTPEKIARQCIDYAEMQSIYAQKVVNAYKNILKHEPKSTIGKSFNNEILAAIADKPNAKHNLGITIPGRSRIKRVYRGEPLDEYRVEISYQTPLPIGINAKITGMAGNKSIACDVWPDENMPVDENGIRADVVVYGRGMVARINPSQSNEQLINHTTATCERMIKDTLASGFSKEAMGVAKDIILNYYSLVCPELYDVMSKANANAVEEHLEYVYTKGIYLLIRADNNTITEESMLRLIQSPFYQPTPVKYTTPEGKEFVTNTDVVIGDMQYMVLSKSDVKPFGCSGTRRQHHALPAVVNKSTKFSDPTKVQACRHMGESEHRQLSAWVGADTIANHVDYTNNPLSHEKVVKTIVMAKDPSNIKQLIDRNIIPVGNGRPIAFLKHINQCFNIKITEKEAKK